MAFADIRTLRSILPKTINVMALTATATKDTMDCVIQGLLMKEGEELCIWYLYI